MKISESIRTILQDRIDYAIQMSIDPEERLERARENVRMAIHNYREEQKRYTEFVEWTEEIRAFLNQDDSCTSE